MRRRYERAWIALFAGVLLAAGAVTAQQIETRTVVTRGAWLGVYLGDAGAESGWDDSEGAIVREVVKDGPADKAGLRENDIIIKLQNRTVRDADDVTRDIRKMKPGDEVKLIVLRDKKKVTLTAKLQERKRAAERTLPADVNEKTKKEFERQRDLRPLQGLWMQKNRRMGVQLQELDRDLAGYFQIEEGEGVLVIGVDKESPAAEAGLRSGDVITAVNGKKVHKAREVAKALEENESGEQEVVFVRKGTFQSVTVKLPERPERNFRIQLEGSGWPFSREMMEELREDLEELRYEFDQLKIKLDIQVDEH